MFSPFSTPTYGQHFKLNPSMLTFLWDDCPRCFWMQARHGLYRPSIPMPKVFGRLHEVLQDYYEGCCPSSLSPSLPKGRIMSSEMWVESRKLTFPGTPDSCYLRGKVDHLMQFNDGSWGVIDYKTTTISEVDAEKYARQLHAYAWALERAANSDARLGPVTRLGLLCVEPAGTLIQPENGRAALTMDHTWIEVERDDAAFSAFLRQAMALLSRKTPPVSNPACKHCSFCTQRRERDAEPITWPLPF